MGNMCLDLCKEITSCDRKARLTKEIKDIHPIDDGSLKVRANGSVRHRQHQQLQQHKEQQTKNGVLLHETSRLSGEVTYTYSGGDLDDTSLSELNELIREVSLEEPNDENMNVTQSSTSIEITTLLADLESYKFFNSEGSTCDERTPRLSRASSFKNSSSPYVQARTSHKYNNNDINNNYNPADEVSHLLSLLEKDQCGNTSQSDCYSFELSSIKSEHNEYTERCMDKLDVDLKSNTNNGTDTNNGPARLRNLILVSNDDSNDNNGRDNNSNINLQEDDRLGKSTPDFIHRQSTVFDTYLKDINETFSKQDEIAYLLSLLENVGEPYNKVDGDTSIESIMRDDYSFNDSNTNTPVKTVPPAKSQPDRSPNTNLEPTQPEKGPPVVRKISPVFSIDNKFIIPARKAKEENIETVVNAMDFVCQLICANRPVPYPIHRKVDRPNHVPTKDVEVQYLLNKLENDKRLSVEKEKEYIKQHENGKIPVIANCNINSVNDKKYKQSCSDSKSKTNHLENNIETNKHSKSSHYVHSKSTTNTHSEQQEITNKSETSAKSEFHDHSRSTTTNTQSEQREITNKFETSAQSEFHDHSKSTTTNTQSEQRDVTNDYENSAQAEFLEMLSDVTESEYESEETTDLDESIAKELEIESLLSKLTKMKMKQTRESSAFIRTSTPKSEFLKKNGFVESKSTTCKRQLDHVIETNRVSSNTQKSELERNSYQENIPNNVKSPPKKRKREYTPKNENSADIVNNCDKNGHIEKLDNSQTEDEVPYLLSLLLDKERETGHEDTDAMQHHPTLNGTALPNGKADDITEPTNCNGLDDQVSLLERCKTFDLGTKEKISKNAIVTEEVDMSEISVTYRLQRYRKNIVLPEDEFSEETRSIKNELHLYTRGSKLRSLSPCYERDEEFVNPDILSLDHLLEQLSAYEFCKAR